MNEKETESSLSDAASPAHESLPVSPQNSSYSAHTPLQDEPNYEEDDVNINDQSFFTARPSLDKTEDQSAYFSFSTTCPGSAKHALPADEEEQLDYVDDLVDDHSVPQESVLSPLHNESSNAGDSKEIPQNSDAIQAEVSEEDGEVDSDNDDDIEEGEVLSSSTEGEIDDGSDDPISKKCQSGKSSPSDEPIILGPALPVPEFNKENETPWERAMRQAKERMRKAKELRKKEKELGFDQKMLNQNLLDAEELDPVRQEKSVPLTKSLHVTQPVQPKDDDMLAEYYLAAAADLHRPRFLPSTLNKVEDWELKEIEKGLEKKKKSASRSRSSSSTDSSDSDRRSVSPSQANIKPSQAAKSDVAIEDRLSQWRTANRFGPSGDSWKDPWERRRVARPQRNSPAIGKKGERKSGSRSSEYSTHSSSRSSSKSSYSSSRSYSRSLSRSKSASSSSSSYSSRSSSSSSYSKKKRDLKSRMNSNVKTSDKSRSTASRHSKSKSREAKTNSNDKNASKDSKSNLGQIAGSRGRNDSSPKSRLDSRNNSGIPVKSSAGGSNTESSSRPSVKMHLPSRPKAMLSRPAPPPKRSAPRDINEKSSNKRSRIDNSALHSESINPTIPLSSEAAQLTRESAIELQQAQERQSFSSASKRGPPPRIHDRSLSPKEVDSPEKRFIGHTYKKDASRPYPSGIPRAMDSRHKPSVESSHRHVSGSSGRHNYDRHREERQDSRYPTSNMGDSSRRDKVKEKPSRVSGVGGNLPAPANHRSAAQSGSASGPPPSGSSAPAGDNKKTAVRRREELLKQLQAVEDAIAKKRAKMGASLKS